ncbi:hypothetical protein CDL15_Pgr000442 [Punica granatum]|nr:hypothetical protein CDL15_Pgr000442 [Punica granatum]
MCRFLLPELEDSIRRTHHLVRNTTRSMTKKLLLRGGEWIRPTSFRLAGTLHPVLRLTICLGLSFAPLSTTR